LLRGTRKLMYLEAHQLKKIFHVNGSALEALSDFSLTLNQGELICLTGRSGTGKSTVLRLLAGLENPNDGRIFLEGNEITKDPAESRSIALMFQTPSLFLHFTARQNIEFGLKIRNQKLSDVQEWFARLVSAFQLQPFLDQFPTELSGGEQQRIALARAIIIRPKVLLLDEPFANLDPVLRIKIRNEIRLLQRELNLTTLMVTHDEREAEEIADRIVKLPRAH
jgi:ABC-type sugar transport system ATPase subunit